MDVSRFMEIDYQRYGDGEALLGWLNATVSIEHPDGQEFDGNALLDSPRRRPPGGDAGPQAPRSPTSR